MSPSRSLIASVCVGLLLVPATVRAADAPMFVVGARPTVRFSPTERAIFRVCGTIGAATLAVLFAGLAITGWRAGVHRGTAPLRFYLAIALLWAFAAGSAFLAVLAATAGETLPAWSR